MLKKYTLICPKCGNQFVIECSEKNFERGKHKVFCSRSCANGRPMSDITKAKIGNALKYEESECKRNYHTCRFCGKVFYNSSSQSKYCSSECKHYSKYINTLIKYFNFDASTLGTFAAIDEYNKVRSELYHEYWENELTGREVAEKYNYPSYCNLTGKVFKHLDIPTRTLKDTNILNVSNGKIGITTPIKYKQGWYTTWNGKEVYLRSSYEFEYASILDEQHIDYDVEKLRIKYYNTTTKDFRCAIPDFYLPDNNTIVEIKSSYTLNLQDMKDKFKAYHDLGYNTKLILNHKETNIDEIIL